MRLLAVADPAQVLPPCRFLRVADEIGAGQGHSILITSGSAICQDAVEVHGVAPQSIGDVVDLVEPQNIEGEAAQDGEDDRALADATGVLVHGDVEHVGPDPTLLSPRATWRFQTVNRS